MVRNDSCACISFPISRSIIKRLSITATWRMNHIQHSTPTISFYKVWRRGPTSWGGILGRLARRICCLQRTLPRCSIGLHLRAQRGLGNAWLCKCLRKSSCSGREDEEGFDRSFMGCLCTGVIGLHLCQGSCGSKGIQGQYDDLIWKWVLCSWRDGQARDGEAWGSVW